MLGNDDVVAVAAALNTRFRDADLVAAPIEYSGEEGKFGAIRLMWCGGYPQVDLPVDQSKFDGPVHTSRVDYLQDCIAGFDKLAAAVQSRGE